MLATLDQAAVRRFTNDINGRIFACDTGEGTECITLELSLRHYSKLFGELNQAINQWSQAVFSGRTAYEVAVEKLFHDQTRVLLTRAERLAARGRSSEVPCYELDGLDELHRWIARFDYLLKHWVSPKLAVSPAPRVRIPADVEEQMRESLKQLTPLPKEWMPSDPEQLTFFQKFENKSE